MFDRPTRTYQVQKGTDERITIDSANPLTQISELVHDQARILDVGAGNGSLGRLLATLDRRVIIDGIEPNAVAARIAEPYYRSMYVGYLTDYIDTIDFEAYDFIVLADVIEHIENPQIFLRQLTERLGERAKLLVSIPNVAFGAVRLSLARGEFNYVDSGILERTHLRFFTYDTAISLFKSLNLGVSMAISLCRSFYRTEFTRSSLGIPGWSLLKYAFITDARAYQYLFCLVRDPKVTTKRLIVGASGIEILVDMLFNWVWTKNVARAIVSHWRH
jgi:2-polyprenyl-3-methyl-5-hydroxy-6-metoxy-1,4-benzoquinol methylase